MEPVEVKLTPLQNMAEKLMDVYNEFAVTEMVGEHLQSEIDRLTEELKGCRWVIEQYINDVESGEKFAELVKLLTFIDNAVTP